MVRLCVAYGVNTQRVLDQAFAQNDVLVLAVRASTIACCSTPTHPIARQQSDHQFAPGVRLGTLERMRPSESTPSDRQTHG